MLLYLGAMFVSAAHSVEPRVPNAVKMLNGEPGLAIDFTDKSAAINTIPIAEQLLANEDEGMAIGFTDQTAMIKEIT